MEAVWPAKESVQEKEDEVEGPVHEPQDIAEDDDERT